MDNHSVYQSGGRGFKDGGPDYNNLAYGKGFAPSGDPSASAHVSKARAHKTRIFFSRWVQEVKMDSVFYRSSLRDEAKERDAGINLQSVLAYELQGTSIR